MPELPEVQTTVNGLHAEVLNRAFVDVWSDWQKMVKRPRDFAQFKKELEGKKIARVWRRAKNVIFELSEGYSLLIHMKMTGHLMVGEWQMANGEWQPKVPGPLGDKVNGFLHVIFFLDNGDMIALSDMRKFAKIELWKTEEMLASPEFLKIGPEPLENSFTFEKFAAIISKKRGKIKQVLMDPFVVAGVGNIYSSEALWWAKIHPEKRTENLSKKELQLLHGAIKKVLNAGIEFGGESFSDYRNVDGLPGKFGSSRQAYKREKLECARCGAPIARIMFAARSAFYCPHCQKL